MPTESQDSLLQPCDDYIVSTGILLGIACKPVGFVS